MNDQKSGAYRAASSGNFQNGTTMTSPNSGSAAARDATAAGLARSALPTTRPARTASGGRTGRMERLPLFSGGTEREPQPGSTPGAPGPGDPPRPRPGPPP